MLTHFQCLINERLTIDFPLKTATEVGDGTEIRPKLLSHLINKQSKL